MPKGIYGRTKTHNHNMSKAKTGTVFSKKHLKNLSLAHKGGKNCRGGNSPKNRSKRLRGKHCGSKNANWKGGISFKAYAVDWTKTLKRSIRERDHYICQFCGMPQLDEAFCVHHIDYDKKNCSPANLISLCRKCHSRTFGNRKYWINYFSGKVKYRE